MLQSAKQLPIRYKSSVHSYYLLVEQFAAANCFSKLPFLDTWRGLHGIRFHDSPYQIESETSSFLTRAELARIRDNRARILASSVMDGRRANHRGLPGRWTCAQQHGYVHSSGKARGSGVARARKENRSSHTYTRCRRCRATWDVKIGVSRATRISSEKILTVALD